MMRIVNRQVFAVLLLLAFSQKVGLELWLHHWLHEPQQVTVSIGSSKKAVVEHQRLHCSCLDDTLMPLDETAVYTLAVPKQHQIALLLPGYCAMLSMDKPLSALRGPPSFSLS